MEKVKEKLNSKFLPSHYLQKNYLKLHHFKKVISVEEYSMNFEQLLLKCDGG